MEALFEGELVQGEELARTARLRRRAHHEITVSKADVGSYQEQGWQLRREGKTSVRLWKEKSTAEQLEDKVWLLFWSMGFAQMNKGRDFRIWAGPKKKQVDVFAMDEHYAIVVECKSSDAQSGHVATSDIHELLGLRGDIAISVKKAYAGESPQVHFVFATRGLAWDSEQLQLAKEKGIAVCRDADLQYYDGVVKCLGRAAKYQIFSILFPADQVPGPVHVPAICGKYGKVRYFCFAAHPEDLLRIAYVHHRRSTPEELAGSYQRMLSGSRLRTIDAFISGGGYFANNIILNFTRKPVFRPYEKEHQAGDVVCGMLELPRHYASAWVIDGQHRLYAYANNERRTTGTVPVLAFESLSAQGQAKLFVEINREQKAVGPNLLWDLYTDIYHDSKEPGQELLKTISQVVKRLNHDRDSALCGYISIPSAIPSKSANLTMATLCDALMESGLVAEKGSLFHSDYASTVGFAVQRLKAFFDVIAKAFPADWAAGDAGLLRTNIGVRIFIVLLRQLHMYLAFKGQGQLYQAQNLTPYRTALLKYLSPALERLQDMSPEERSDIRRASTKALVVDNARRMAWWIGDKHVGFGLELLEGWSPPLPEGETDEKIDRLLEETERLLRRFIAQCLEKTYGPGWYDRIPKEVRTYIHKRLQEQINKETWREPELRALLDWERLRFTTTGQLRDIIEAQWDAFSEAFGEKSYALVQFQSFVDLRNVYAHHEEEECDLVRKNLGYWATRWIRKRMGLDQPDQH
jgi:DGQHR domain-containing protein